MYPAQTTSSTTVCLEPVRHRASRALPGRRSPRARRLASRHTRRLGPRERLRSARVRGDRGDGESGVEQRLQVRPLPADEDSDHARTIVPMTRDVAGVGDDGDEADPEVEHAPKLVLVHVSREPARTRAASSRTTSRAPPRDPSGRTRVRLPRIPPPVTCASPRTSARLPEPPHVVEVEAGRREQVLSVVVLELEDPAHEREAVRMHARGAEARRSRRRLRSANRRSAARARRCRRRCPAKSSSSSL